jgi:hypothetical protein
LCLTLRFHSASDKPKCLASGGKKRLGFARKT